MCLFCSLLHNMYQGILIGGQKFMKEILKVQDIKKTYQSKNGEITALNRY